MTKRIHVILCNEFDKIMKAAYTSSNNYYHFRCIKEIEKGWAIKDEVSGEFKIATLRWMLNVSNWTIKGHVISNGRVSLNITSNEDIYLKLKEGFESRYYMSKEQVPILEIKCLTECLINTNMTFT